MRIQEGFLSFHVVFTKSTQKLGEFCRSPCMQEYLSINFMSSKQVDENKFGSLNYLHYNYRDIECTDCTVETATDVRQDLYFIRIQLYRTQICRRLYDKSWTGGSPKFAKAKDIP